MCPYFSLFFCNFVTEKTERLYIFEDKRFTDVTNPLHLCYKLSAVTKFVTGFRSKIEAMTIRYKVYNAKNGPSQSL